MGNETSSAGGRVPFEDHDFYRESSSTTHDNNDNNYGDAPADIPNGDAEVRPKTADGRLNSNNGIANTSGSHFPLPKPLFQQQRPSTSQSERQQKIRNQGKKLKSFLKSHLPSSHNVESSTSGSGRKAIGWPSKQQQQKLFPGGESHRNNYHNAQHEQHYKNQEVSQNAVGTSDNLLQQQQHHNNMSEQELAWHRHQYEKQQRFQKQHPLAVAGAALQSTYSQRPVMSFMYASEDSHSQPLQHGSTKRHEAPNTEPHASGIGDCTNLIGKMTISHQSPKNSVPPQGRTSTTRDVLGKRATNVGTNIEKLQSDEDQWESAWEEDTESDENDDSDDDGSHKQKPITGSATAAAGDRSLCPSAVAAAASSTIANLRQQQQQHHHSQTMRPTMDGAHSSSLTMARMSHANQHQQYSHQPVNITQHQQHYYNQQQNNQQVYGYGQAVAQMDTTNHREQIKVDQVLREGENGVRWDTSDIRQGYEKPNEMMFHPLLRVLGKGSFGKVVLVQKQSGQEKGGLFAMKILKKTYLLKRKQIARTRTERKVLSIVDHPFIMKLHFAFQTDDKLYLVLDYCAGGELFFHLSRHRRFPEHFTRFYAAELLLALGHLHSKGIIYRDLKPENVLLDSDGHVKLGDFGLAKVNIKHPYKGAKSMCGTPEYMAPEVLLNLGHGFCVDYWGLGMLTYEMMTGLPPWYTTDRSLLYERLRRAQLEIPNSFSREVAHICASLLQRDPRRRLGVRGTRAIMAHDFFRGLDFRSLLDRRLEAPILPCEGWKSASLAPSKQSSQELDAATACFDPQFTRMNVNSMEQTDDIDGSSFTDESVEEELNENTFVGFTFDEDEP